MEHLSFIDAEYESRKRIPKREQFLAQLTAIIPWEDWCALIEPYYPKKGNGRPPREMEQVLRMYLLHVWFSLSDEGTEDAIYDSYAMKRFLRMNFTNESVPDATTLGRFRHLMEENDLSEKIFADVNEHLNRAGLLMHGGSIVEATIISAPSSTKNAGKGRDPEMHSTKKGNQWYFGMKIHSGVDAGSGYVHTITATAANASAISETHNLIRGDDAVVYGDSGYLGLEKRKEVKDDANLSQVEYRICRRPSQSKITPEYEGENRDKIIERQKSSIRCKVEHPFLIVKRQFGYCKAAYKGLKKNLTRFFMLFASANLLMCLRAGRQKEFCAA